MKKYIFLLIPLLMFTACKTEPRERTTDDVILDFNLPKGITYSDVEWQVTEDNTYKLYVTFNMDMQLEPNATYIWKVSDVVEYTDSVSNYFKYDSFTYTDENENLIRNDLLSDKSVSNYVACDNFINTDESGNIVYSRKVLLSNYALPFSVTVKPEDCLFLADSVAFAPLVQKIEQILSNFDSNLEDKRESYFLRFISEADYQLYDALFLPNCPELQLFEIYIQPSTNCIIFSPCAGDGKNFLFLSNYIDRYFKDRYKLELDYGIKINIKD